MASTTSGSSQLRSGWAGFEEMEVPLPGSLVEGPGRAGGIEGRRPIVGRCAAGPSVAPDVPVAVGALPARTGVDEPGVPVRGVVRHPVDDHPEPELVRLGHQAVELLERAEQGVHVAVVGHVVPEVDHGRGEEGGDPQRVDPEPGEVRRDGYGCRRGRRPRHRRSRRTTGGRSGRRRPPATTVPAGASLPARSAVRPPAVGPARRRAETRRPTRADRERSGTLPIDRFSSGPFAPRQFVQRRPVPRRFMTEIHQLTRYERGRRPWWSVARKKTDRCWPKA